MPADDEDVVQWLVNDFGDIEPDGWRSINIKYRSDALFRSEEDARNALEEFGGIEHLNKVRRGLWGVE